MGKTMNKQDQAPRRAGSSREGAATAAAALGLALGLALLAEALAALLGQATGREGWQRGWVDALLLGQPLASDPLWRDLAALLAGCFVLCLAPARHIGPTLTARFDGAALRVEPAGNLGPADAPALHPSRRATWAGLEHWCLHGSGPGCTPWWRPGALPDVELRLSVAVLTGGTELERRRLAEGFSRHIDGSTRLLALGSRLRGLGWRLRIKLDECLWWRPVPPATPWDAGYLPLSAAAVEPLARFHPRRPTLIVADRLHAQVLAQALRALQLNQATFRHPVRLLVLAERGPGVADLCRKGMAAASRVGPHRAPPYLPVFDLQAA